MRPVRIELSETTLLSDHDLLTVSANHDAPGEEPTVELMFSADGGSSFHKKYLADLTTEEATQLREALGSWLEAAYTPYSRSYEPGRE